LGDAERIQGICAARQRHGRGGRHHHRAASSNRSWNDIIMPPIGVITGGVDFSSTFIPLNGEHYDSLAAARQAGAPT
jgi:hypothetical protein